MRDWAWYRLDGEMVYGCRRSDGSGLWDAETEEGAAVKTDLDMNAATLVDPVGFERPGWFEESSRVPAPEPPPEP